MGSQPQTHADKLEGRDRVGLAPVIARRDAAKSASRNHDHQRWPHIREQITAEITEERIFAMRAPTGIGQTRWFNRRAAPNHEGV
jgi:hypothetical protein